MRLGVKALIRCCDVGVCPAPSAKILPFTSFTSLLQVGCATRVGSSAIGVRALSVGLSIDITRSNAQFSVLHRLVANAFERRCDISLGHLSPNAWPSHHTPSAEMPT